MWKRTILDKIYKKKKKKMRELKIGGKEKNQGKTGLGLDNLGIYNFLLSSNFIMSLSLLVLIDWYIYIYIYINSLSQIRLSTLFFLKKRL